MSSKTPLSPRAAQQAKSEQNPAKKARLSEPTSTSRQLDRRTTRILLAVVAQKMFPESRLVGGHARGLAHEASHYALEGPGSDPANVAKLESGVRDLIARDLPIEVIQVPWIEAREVLSKSGQKCAVALMESRVQEHCKMVQIDGIRLLYIHDLHPSTGSLAGQEFRLRTTEDGLLLCFDSAEYEAQPSLVEIQNEHKRFGIATGVHCVGDLNHFLAVGRDRKDFILNAEFRQEQKIANIVSQAVSRMKDPSTRVRVIAIAGPTSSGKTTFATKLSLYLKNEGLMSKLLTVDHYYLPLDQQPKFKETGKRSCVDYDSIESMDVDLVNKHITELLNGEKVMTPHYDMKTGYRIGEGVPFQVPESKFGGEYESILIIEGIHALNPQYTKMTPRGNVFKIYICPQTVLQLDDCNAFKAADQRLLRRMSRDYLFRGHTASRTLSMWPNVRRGEQKWIFPFQNDVDFQMNSGMEYEISVLKTHVEPLLRMVTPEDAQYYKAQQLLTVLDLVSAWPDTDVPGTSLLREFIGQGLFDCH